MEELDENLKTKWAEIVVRVRGQRSQAEFADLLGVSQSTIQFWENRKNLPTLANVEKMAEVMGQLPEELIAYLYGRNIGGAFALEQGISTLSMAELAELLEAVSQRLAKGK